MTMYCMAPSGSASGGYLKTFFKKKRVSSLSVTVGSLGTTPTHYPSWGANDPTADGGPGGDSFLTVDGVNVATAKGGAGGVSYPRHNNAAPAGGAILTNGATVLAGTKGNDGQVAPAGWQGTYFSGTAAAASVYKGYGKGSTGKTLTTNGTPGTPGYVKITVRYVR